jgi:hypothetical protein
MTLAAASPPPITFPPQSADHALLREIIQQERLAHARPDPDWWGWLVELVRAALERLPDVFLPARRALQSLGLSMDTVATLLLALLAALIVAVATIAALRLLRRGTPAPLPRDAMAAEALAAEPREKGAWRASLEAHLREGRMAEALEAVWWWLAASVSRGPVDPSWTSRELLARAGRLDLRPWASLLDRMTYGPQRPAVAEVRHLVDALEGAV